MYSFDTAGTSELETALSNYKSISADAPGQLIWSVAENYRFETAIVEVFDYLFRMKF